MAQSASACSLLTVSVLVGMIFVSTIFLEQYSLLGSSAPIFFDENGVIIWK